MQVENFHTQQAQTAGPKQAAAFGKQLKIQAGLGFIDLILGRMQQSGLGNGTIQTTGTTKTTDTGNDQTLNIAQILATNPDIEQKVKNFLSDENTTPQEALFQTLALNQQAYDEQLKPIATPGTQTGEQDSKNGADNSAQKNNADLFLTTTQQNAANFQQQLEQSAQNVGTLVNKGNPTEGPPASGQIVYQNPHDGTYIMQSYGDDGLTIPIRVTLTPIPTYRGSTDIPVSFEAAADELDINGIIRIPNIQAINPQNLRLIAGNTNATQPLPVITMDADITQSFLPFDCAFLPPEGFDGEFFNLGQSGVTLYSSGNAAPASTMNPAAGTQAPHPATQMVAATIQKAAGNGETRNITLQLDPPELGRVEVRMSFGKDKKIEAKLIAEKPETYSMLQKDSHILERALQNAGLDADSSLSFELAGDDHEFSHNGSHDGHRSGGGNAQSDDDEAIIESTMTWHVDPETGHMHYNILV